MPARKKQDEAQHHEMAQEPEAPGLEAPGPEGPGPGELIEWIKGQQEVPSVYANHVQVSTGPWDFVIMLGEIVRLDDGDVAARKIVQITMSPQHAKAMAEVLARQIARYEERFGELPDVNRRIRDVMTAAKEEAGGGK